MPTNPQDIARIAAPVVEANGAFLVDVAIQQGRPRAVVQVFVDTDTGIMVDQCAHISRLLATMLEEQDVMPGPYELLVSSPGLERPLKHLRQVQKNVGRKFRMRIRGGSEEHVLEAVLVAVDRDQLTFRTEGGAERTVAFGDVQDMKEVLPW